MKPGPKPNLAQRAIAVAYARQGLTLREIGLMMGLSYQRVYAILKQAGMSREYRWREEG